VFIQGGIWHTSVIPVGSNHFTNDIVYVLHTPHNTAEYLKLKYGSAIADPPAEDESGAPISELIDVESLAGGENQQIDRQLLNEIVQARAEQLVELIYNEIQRSGYDGLLQAGMVITGGGAQLPRFDELMRDMLGVPVRVGVPAGLTGLADSMHSPAYATSVGLLRWGMRHGSTTLDLPYNGRDRGGWGKLSIYDRFKSWLREFLP
jgi:cell division protein FtsA